MSMDLIRCDMGINLVDKGARTNGKAALCRYEINAAKALAAE